MNVDRIEQPVSELQTVVFRLNIKTAANIKLKEVIFLTALFGYRRVMHLLNNIG
jgi:hypothetical protein